MNRLLFTIFHENNKLDAFNMEKKPYFTSTWFMEFGKFISEIFDEKGTKIFTIVKKFQFWKWKMVYKITDHHNKHFILTSQNSKNTIYQLDVENTIYKIAIHYKKRTSIFKNDVKIAEIDNSFASQDFSDAIKLTLVSPEDLKIVFLLFSCLKIGEADQNKPVLKSQKQLESNNEPWN
ncbi:hypothetical protein N9V96_01160 [Polaribacter sp.]|nr:hypothetical protein [Polaribacter sp.]